ncbi:MAG: hypothetical protein IT305_00215 [Chloroflexi bacterium]|nr:hypothetical protein [Chloroflexota bacterium]
MSALMVALLLMLACQRDAAPSTVRGLIVDVQAASFSRISSFTVRADDGQTYQFVVEGDVGMTASHVREHMTLIDPVTVTYRSMPDGLVATRIEDG